MTPINSINLNEQNETRLLVVEMSHDEVNFNVFFIIFGKLSFCATEQQERRSENIDQNLNLVARVEKSSKSVREITLANGLLRR